MIDLYHRPQAGRIYVLTWISLGLSGIYGWVGLLLHSPSVLGLAALSAIQLAEFAMPERVGSSPFRRFCFCVALLATSIAVWIVWLGVGEIRTTIDNHDPNNHIVPGLASLCLILVQWSIHRLVTDETGRTPLAWTALVAACVLTMISTVLTLLGDAGKIADVWWADAAAGGLMYICAIAWVVWRLVSIHFSPLLWLIQAARFTLRQ